MNALTSKGKVLTNKGQGLKSKVRRFAPGKVNGQLSSSKVDKNRCDHQLTYPHLQQHANFV